ncbi:barstar family protein [Stenotrophomonas tumulicola]|uniref:Barstar family protein n=1 Tax=Stenotrophomonas tumulicola TaxID=1685415 RepID=A0A7W3FJ79_9GAMM|nr:barstar family protein [Stenotrophomonas tumulicola]MBA8680277.1 barstar family protein [Stenotrophomonas tumulicola]
MTDRLILDGSAITDIPSLYEEINRVFMSSESWRLGHSLDALDDLLYGAYGALHGHDRMTVEWRDMETSRAALGAAATKAWLQQKLLQPGNFNTTLIQAQLRALEQGTGKTYFDIVLEIFAAHATVRLLPA